MGGRDAGQEASDIAGSMIRRQFYYMQPDGLSVEEMLANSLREANRSLSPQLSAGTASGLAWVRLPRWPW